MATSSSGPTRTSAPPAVPGPLPGEPRFPPGTVLAGRYRVVSLLGRGGMGEVYRADDLKLRQAVALKFLPPAVSADPARLSRFHDEVRLARSVSHPNVCRVHDIGEAEGETFLSMEYVDGEDLSSLLRRAGRLPADRAVELARQVCAALAAVHEAGLLHRDLKPANVLVDGRGRPRLSDFGLAVHEGSARGEVAGTPAYMAPEQAEGRELSPRTDVYALGLVLYEVFTGKPAFRADTAKQLLDMQRQAAPVPPREHVGDLDPRLERVILQCLEKDPARRPASALAVAAGLSAGVDLAAVLAAGATPSPEMVAAAGEEEGMHPGLAVGLAVLIVLLFAADLALYRRTVLFAQLPFDKPPAVLAERARSVLTGLGHPAEAGDEAFGFDYDARLLTYLEDHDRSPRRWQRLASGRPAAAYFWYRRAPGAMVPRHPFRLVSEQDPPLGPGMATVRLDTTGRLLDLAVRPGEALPDVPETGPPDWERLLAEAGLGHSALAAAAPAHAPPVFADLRAAWTGAFEGREDLPLRVEAASLQGRVVSYATQGPWSAPTERAPRRFGMAAADLATLAMAVPAFAGAFLLAWRNHRLGRGDRQGARRLAVFSAAAYGAYWLVGAGHSTAALREWSLFTYGFGRSLFFLATTWLLYMGLEPYVRRHWPELLIGSTRLLSGRLRDPRVGRDVLAGLLGAVAGFLVVALGHVVAVAEGRPEPRLLEVNLDMLLGPTAALAAVGSTAAQVPGAVLVMLMMLVLLRVLLRRQALAVLAASVLYAGASVAAFSSPPFGPGELLCYLLAAVVPVLLTTRFGLLAMAVVAFVSFLEVPAAPSLAAWHAPTMLFAWGLVVGLALFGAWAALGRRRLLGADLLD